MIVIELTHDNEILKVYSILPPLGIAKEIEYRVEYIPCPTCNEMDCGEGHHDMCEERD